MPRVKKEVEQVKETTPKDFVSGTGRRKTSVARVFLYKDKGDFTVNGISINDYFPNEKEKIKWMRPFHVIGVSHPNSQFSATIKVYGSGRSSQLNAIIHGLSRTLSKISEEYSQTLRKQGLLTRDPRMVERKKYWFRKARKTPQYSKR
ncbi:MAG TPA: 30S ribosomal protein S9 [Patescibacteria group bacterium]|nr:30S ribosomal protein S9 [Patescibacteria group bacterium]